MSKNKITIIQEGHIIMMKKFAFKVDQEDTKDQVEYDQIMNVLATRKQGVFC